MKYKQRLRLIIEKIIKKGFDNPQHKRELKEIFKVFVEDCSETNPDHAYWLAIDNLNYIFGESVIKTVSK